MVEPAARLLMRRPNAVPVKDGDSELYLAFESKEEREQWIVESLSQSILDLKVWRTSCDFLIPLSIYPTASSTQTLPLFISCLKRGAVELEGALVTPSSNTLAQTFSQQDNE